MSKVGDQDWLTPPKATPRTSHDSFDGAGHYHCSSRPVLIVARTAMGTSGSASTEAATLYALHRKALTIAFLSSARKAGLLSASTTLAAASSSLTTPTLIARSASGSASSI